MSVKNLKPMEMKKTQFSKNPPEGYVYRKTGKEVAEKDKKGDIILRDEFFKLNDSEKFYLLSGLSSMSSKVLKKLKKKYLGE